MTEAPTRSVEEVTPLPSDGPLVGGIVELSLEEAATWDPRIARLLNAARELDAAIRAFRAPGEDAAG